MESQSGGWAARCAAGRSSQVRMSTAPSRTSRGLTGMPQPGGTKKRMPDWYAAKENLQGAKTPCLRAAVASSLQRAKTPCLCAVGALQGEVSVGAMFSPCSRCLRISTLCLSSQA